MIFYPLPLLTKSTPPLRSNPGSATANVSGSSITSSHSSLADQKVTLVFFLGGVTYAEIAALRFLAQQDDGNLWEFMLPVY